VYGGPLGMARTRDQAGRSGLRKGCRGGSGPCRRTGSRGLRGPGLPPGCQCSIITITIICYEGRYDTERSDVYSLLEAGRAACSRRKTDGVKEHLLRVTVNDRFSVRPSFSINKLNTITKSKLLDGRWGIAPPSARLSQARWHAAIKYFVQVCF
jgi:hypothetical protein